MRTVCVGTGNFARLDARRKTMAASLCLVQRRIDRAFRLNGKAAEDDMRSYVNGASACPCRLPALAQGRSAASALEARLAELDCCVWKRLDELSSAPLVVSSSGASGRDASSQIAEGSRVELHSCSSLCS